MMLECGERGALLNYTLSAGWQKSANILRCSAKQDDYGEPACVPYAREALFQRLTNHQAKTEAKIITRRQNCGAPR